MSIKRSLVVFGIIFLTASNLAYTRTQAVLSHQPVDKKKGSGFYPGGMFAYNDLNFDSTTGDNFNRFNGHSRLYGVTGDNIKLGRDFRAGLSLFKVDTFIDSFKVLAPSPLTSTRQTTHNHTLFGYVLKPINKFLLANVSAGYGQNRTDNSMIILPDTPSQEIGVSSSRSDNWFVGSQLAYIKTLKPITFSGNLQILYSQVKTDPSILSFSSTPVDQLIQGLTNKSLFLMETATVYYKLNQYVSPFIGGGLIQVLHYKNNRALVNPTLINGSIPQLSINQNAYKLAGGLSIQFRNGLIRLEEQYYNSHNIFRTYQTLASIKFYFS